MTDTADLPGRKVSGKHIDLDERRYVFVGLCDEEPNTIFIGFRNAEGEETRLSISAEARDALVALLHRVRRDADSKWELVV
jgi:hypothetical protein